MTTQLVDLIIFGVPFTALVISGFIAGRRTEKQRERTLKKLMEYKR